MQSALESRVFNCFANSELDVFIEVHLDDLHALDRDQRWTWSKPTSHRTSFFKIWTVHEVGMRYEHVNHERVLHNSRTEVVLNPNTNELLGACRTCHLIAVTCNSRRTVVQRR